MRARSDRTRVSSAHFSTSLQVPENEPGRVDARSTLPGLDTALDRKHQVVRSPSPATGSYRAHEAVHGQRWRAAHQPGSLRSTFLVERVTAGAGAGGVGVVDGEALLFDAVDEIDGCADQVRGAHTVGDHLDTTDVDDHVPVQFALVEVELVAQP